MNHQEPTPAGQNVADLTSPVLTKDDLARRWRGFNCPQNCNRDCLFVTVPDGFGRSFFPRKRKYQAALRDCSNLPPSDPIGWGCGTFSDP